VTTRDREIVFAVGRMAQATTDQLTRLFFGDRSTALRRLAKLVALRTLDVNITDPSAPNIYTLGTRATTIIGTGPERTDLHRGRVGRHLDEHLRALNDLRVEHVLAARERSDVAVDAFHSDLDLRRAAGAVPPAYIHDALVELTLPGGRLVLVVEVDIGTESISVFATKVDATVSLWRKGVKCWGAAAGTWRPAAFATSEARARALARVMVEREGGTLWLIADLALVRERGALGAIFATAEEVHATPRDVPVEYRGALVGQASEVQP
jgi:hypothetical protein